MSKDYLARHPMCECPEFCCPNCQAQATVVDHIIPHHGDEALAFDERNFQALAKSCHDRKTARETGLGGAHE